MKPTLQTRISPNGDCMRSCIASLLGVKIETVPDFTAMPDDGKNDYPVFWLEMQAWLSRRNLFFLEIEIGKIPWMPLPYDVYGIAVGVRESGVSHAIIVKCEGNSFEAIFDPLGGNPQEALANGCAIQRVCFLVPRDPELFMKMGAALEKIEASSAGIASVPLRNSIAHECTQALGKSVFETPIPKEAPAPSLILGPNGRPVS